MPRIVLVLPESAKRLDVLLARLLQEQGLSRTAIQRLMKEGRVLLDGRPVRASAEAEAGQEVVLEAAEDRDTTSVTPLDLPLRILYEDGSCLAVDKPSGLVTHPAKGHWDDTLVNALAARKGPLSSGYSSDRPGILHRLDKETSGVLLVAKTDRAQALLAEQFQARAVEKVYLALVWGTLTQDPVEVSEPIGRHPKNRQKMAVVAEGRPALTLFRTVEVLTHLSLVEARPHTGRTHQVRVHLAHLRHPIVGDVLYGGHPENGLPNNRLKERVRGAGRFFLHAHSLTFTSPDAGRVTVLSPLPADFLDMMEVFRGHA